MKKYAYKVVPNTTFCSVRIQLYYIYITILLQTLKKKKRYVKLIIIEKNVPFEPIYVVEYELIKKKQRRI